MDKKLEPVEGEMKGISADDVRLLRMYQFQRVMPTIGALLDAWAGTNLDFKSDVLDQYPNLHRWMIALEKAVTEDPQTFAPVLAEDGPVEGKDANGESIESWTNEYVVQRMLENYARTISTGSESQHNEAFRCRDEVFRRMSVSTPLPVDPPEKLKAICPHCGKSFESWLAQRSPVGTPIQAGDVGASLNVKAPTPNSVDLEEKLREIVRDSWLNSFGDYTRKELLNLATQAAALGRAEGLAASIRVITEVIKANTGPPEEEWLDSPQGVLGEAIRALKENK